MKGIITILDEIGCIVNGQFWTSQLLGPITSGNCDVRTILTYVVPVSRKEGNNDNVPAKFPAKARDCVSQTTLSPCDRGNWQDEELHRGLPEIHRGPPRRIIEFCCGSKPLFRPMAHLELCG